MKSCIYRSATFLAICLVAATAGAEGLASPDEAVALVDTAMKKIVQDDVDSVADIFKPYVCIATSEFDAISKRLAATYKARPASLGDALGYQFVKKEVIGDTMLRVTYLEKFKHRPIEWDFFFYKADDEWKIMDYSSSASLVIIFNISIPPVVAPNSNSSPSRAPSN